MASTASSSSSTVAPHPQAGPLPLKRGEIGYRPDLLPERPAHSDPQTAPSLPAHHPADRDAAAAAVAVAAIPVFSNVPLSPAPNASAPTQPAADDANSTHSAGKRSILSFLKRKRAPKVLGISLTTFIRFFAQLAFIGGTLAAWIILTIRMNTPHSSVPDNSGKNSDTSSSSDGNSIAPDPATAGIFIHVAFGIGTLAQLLFLERCVFRMRAERYMHLHPGELLPSHMRRELAGSHPGLAYAPWNRPPLPTYAAALAESGIGTGDQEDAIIAAVAIAPAPAYGKTRGSKLLLAGPLTDAHRDAMRQFQRASQASTVSARSHLTVRPASQMTEREQERPVSYRSMDEDWNERLDAARARDLEETLDHLEEGSADGHARQP